MDKPVIYAFPSGIGQGRIALDYANAGKGTVLHVWAAQPGVFPDAPACFKRAPRWGHLLDMDYGRLVNIALYLGVKVIKVGKVGQKGQHIDLCGNPLAEAIEISVPFPENLLNVGEPLS